MSKLAQLNLPAFVITWICSFLTGRSQQCKVNGALSDAVNIGHSVVQDSGIGPTLYIVMKSDLCALSELNDIFKYADDTTLLGGFINVESSFESSFELLEFILDETFLE